MLCLKKHNKHNHGFTMVEVVVAAVIFALTAAGFYATISALTAPAEFSTQEVTAAFLGKQKLEQLRAEVSADDWEEATSPLAIDHYGPEDITVDGITYSINYTVTADGYTNQFGKAGRVVALTVTW